MIIDSHAHIVMPPESFRFMAELVGGRANPNTLPKIPDASVRKMAEELVKSMDNVGTDVQFISPRPYLQMHSVKPGRVTELWSTHCNDLIARFVEMFPERLRGVAGLPQYMDEPLESRAIPELRRCVDQLGFVGCLINPDPTEGLGDPPGLGDPFWHPLYRVMTELNVPGLIHSAGSCSARESYTLKFINEESIAIVSLLGARTFDTFPDLKIVVVGTSGDGGIADHVKEIVQKVKGLPDDAVAAIVGHTNTVGPVIEGLTGRTVEPIADQQFDRLFVLSIPAAGAATVAPMRYGQAT